MLISRVGEASAGFLRGKLWEDVTHAEPLSMLTPRVAFFLASAFAVSSSAASAAAIQTEAGSEKFEIADTQPGNYLSALIASADRDTPAAEVYSREALRADPRNADLLERAFEAALSNGDESSANSPGSGSLPGIRTTTSRASQSRFTISNKDNLRLREPICRARTHCAPAM